jgi:signal transduction histidine kinase
MTAVTVGGWLLALVAGGAAMTMWLALRRRAELVARACHEVAGPLHAAGMVVHAVARETPSPRLPALELELRRAALALEDLDAARLGRGGRDRLDVVDLGALLAQQALAWQPVARAHGRQLRVAAPSGLLVRADRVRLAQALGNLLANAVEHGGARVELRAVPGERTVRVEVGDDGDGLPAPVRRLTAQARAGRGARGRGLAIAAEIAERHGGRLAAAPTGRGARLALELPVERPAA